MIIDVVSDFKYFFMSKYTEHLNQHDWNVVVVYDFFFFRNIKPYKGRKTGPISFCADPKWGKACKEADDALELPSNERQNLICKFQPQPDSDDEDNGKNNILQCFPISGWN